MQSIELVESSICLFTPRIPLCGQLVEVVVDILLELADVLRAEGVRDGLALSRVLLAIAGVEEATLDGDEGIVVIAAGETISFPWFTTTATRLTT